MPVTFYPHQISAIQWMSKIENCRRFIPTQPRGGILAHAMGLGKTTSMLGLIEQSAARLTLVVCPKSVLEQWREEAQKVTTLVPEEITVYHGSQRTAMLIGQASGVRIVLTTFDIVRLDHAIHDNKADHRVTLFSRVWDRIVVDEAHHICEQGSKTARAIRTLQSPNRWCITGTPFKNGVADLVALAKFLCVAPYSDPSWWRVYSKNRVKLQEWREAFVNMLGKDALDLPIVNSQLARCPRSDAETRLVDDLEKVNALRVTAAVTGANTTTTTNETLTGWYDGPENPSQQHELLKILRLRQLANHPLMLVPTEVAEFLCGGDARVDGSQSCHACGMGSDVQGGGALCDKHQVCTGCQSQNIMCPLCLVQGLNRQGRWLHSSKTRQLWDYVETHRGDKMVVFSQWTTCLDLLALMFKEMGVTCIRFDGRINSLEERTEIIQHFRDDTECKILLTSLGAGGEGLNLTCATHVVLMEPYWNCAAEQQAVDRVHRIGQAEPVHVLRLIMEPSVEQWVLDIQKFKNQELDRLLWGLEPTEIPKYVSRNGNALLRPADAMMSVKLKFNEPVNETIYAEKSTGGNLVRFLRVPVGNKRKHTDVQ